uniref:Mitochondrial import inner membrane translocase subunit Tim21 n=1 Tax=Oryctolagus cuniculus TaxID=9986 RepID=A0A5F9CG03_RABIT
MPQSDGCPSVQSCLEESGKRELSCLKPGPRLTWGRQEPRRTPRPEPGLGAAQKALWTGCPSPRKAEEDSSKQVSVHGAQGRDPAVSASQKVKEAGRDFSYLLVVLIGIGITGGLFYTIFKELFSASSPHKIYGKALEKCRSHPEVIGVFGEPVKGYGEMTRRGRRQHVSFIEYVKDGLKYMRVKFYIEGSEPGKQGTVHVEVKENQSCRGLEKPAGLRPRLCTRWTRMCNPGGALLPRGRTGASPHHDALHLLLGLRKVRGKCAFPGNSILS